MISEIHTLYGSGVDQGKSCRPLLFCQWTKRAANVFSSGPSAPPEAFALSATEACAIGEGFSGGFGGASGEFVGAEASFFSEGFEARGMDFRMNWNQTATKGANARGEKIVMPLFSAENAKNQEAASNCRFFPQTR